MPQIILIRHSEKNRSGVHLSHQGKIRARYLVEYFNTLCQRNPICAVFAQKQHSAKSSNRCVETITPLCQSLGISYDDSCLRKEIKKLVVKIKRRNDPPSNTILICWEHRELPKIAHYLGLPSRLDWSLDPFNLGRRLPQSCPDPLPLPLPQSWSDQHSLSQMMDTYDYDQIHHRFDVTWVIDNVVGDLRLRVFEQFKIGKEIPRIIFPIEIPRFCYVFPKNNTTKDKFPSIEMKTRPSIISTDRYIVGYKD